MQQEHRDIIDLQQKARTRRPVTGPLTQDAAPSVQNMVVLTPQGRIPDHVFARIGSVNAAEVTWICPACGIIRPSQCAQGYLRRECPCEREARYHLQDMAHQASVDAENEAVQKAKDAEEASSDACYTWLGEDYSQYGMDVLTFKTFETPTRELAMAKLRMEKYSNALPNTILLHGPWGVGKTHLACAILNARREQGKPGLFTTGMDLFNAIMARQRAERSYQDILSKMIKTPLLVIDDPDHIAATDFRVNTYKELFNKRCNRGYPTIITTNIAIKRDAMDLQAVIGGAAASRLNNGLELLGIKGEDYRPKLIGK